MARAGGVLRRHKSGHICMIALLLIAAASASVAADDKPARLDNPDLNCQAGYEALVAQTRAQSGLVEAPSDSPSLMVFRSPGEKAIYTLTRKTHPAYPAIVRQNISGVGGGGTTIRMLSCGYGDHAAMRRFMGGFIHKNAELKAEVESGHSPFARP
jgi:hypothetical protein